MHDLITYIISSSAHLSSISSSLSLKALSATATSTDRHLTSDHHRHNLSNNVQEINTDSHHIDKYSDTTSTRNHIIINSPRSNDLEGPRSNDLEGPRSNDLEGPKSDDLEGPRSNDLEGPRSNDLEGPRSNDLEGPRSNDLEGPRSDDLEGHGGNHRDDHIVYKGSDDDDDIGDNSNDYYDDEVDDNNGDDDAINFSSSTENVEDNECRAVVMTSTEVLNYGSTARVSTHPPLLSSSSIPSSVQPSIITTSQSSLLLSSSSSSSSKATSIIMGTLQDSVHTRRLQRMLIRKDRQTQRFDIEQRRFQRLKKLNMCPTSNRELTKLILGKRNRKDGWNKMLMMKNDNGNIEKINKSKGNHHANTRIIINDENDNRDDPQNNGHGYENDDNENLRPYHHHHSSSKKRSIIDSNLLTNENFTRNQMRKIYQLQPINNDNAATDDDADGNDRYYSIPHDCNDDNNNDEVFIDNDDNDFFNDFQQFIGNSNNAPANNNQNLNIIDDNSRILDQEVEDSNLNEINIDSNAVVDSNSIPMDLLELMASLEEQSTFILGE
jgi:hypothetical protein